MVYDEEVIRQVLLDVAGEKMDYTDYDFDDNLVVDEEYYGWQKAIETVAEKLGISLDDEE